MTPAIHIDDELYGYLKDHAEPFTDTPNAVLRRLLRLKPAHDGHAATPEGSHPSPGQEVRVGESERSNGRAGRPYSTKGTRAPRGSLLSEDAYELPILEVLHERGGRAPTREVIDELENRIGDKLTALDRERTRSGEMRWRNRAQFVRLRLIETGDMAADAPRGTWVIAPGGRRRVERSDRLSGPSTDERTSAHESPVRPGPRGEE